MPRRPGFFIGTLAPGCLCVPSLWRWTTGAVSGCPALSRDLRTGTLTTTRLRVAARDVQSDIRTSAPLAAIPTRGIATNDGLARATFLRSKTEERKKSTTTAAAGSLSLGPLLLPLPHRLGRPHLVDAGSPYLLVVAECATELCNPTMNSRVLLVVWANASVAADIVL